MTRDFERHDGCQDVFSVMEFGMDNVDVGVGDCIKFGDTLNPFATMSSDGLAQLVVGMVDKVGGDGALWKGQAAAMLSAVMSALTWLRDTELLDLDAGTVREFTSLKKIMELARHPDLPPHIRMSLSSYLMSLPGYSEKKKEKQSQATLDQHGHLEMQFTKILGKYGEIADSERLVMDTLKAMMGAKPEIDYLAAASAVAAR